MALITAMLVAVGLTGLTTTAIAGDSATTAAKKKKKKKCPAGTSKKVVKKKNGKKKITCVPNPAQPPTGTATLSISPTSFDFGGLNQQDPQNCQAPPDPDCPTQNFTVANTGSAASGAPTVSIAIIATDPGEPPAFSVFANTCAGPIAPGGSCTVTVRAHTPDNFDFVSRLDVTASPGGTASATLAAQ